MFKLETSVALGSGYYGSKDQKSEAIVVYRQFEGGFGLAIITKKEIQTTMAKQYRFRDEISTNVLEIGEDSTMDIILDLRSKDNTEIGNPEDKERAMIFQALSDREIQAIEILLDVI